MASEREKTMRPQYGLSGLRNQAIDHVPRELNERNSGRKTACFSSDTETGSKMPLRAAVFQT
jgi:hypothetical protein